MNDTCITETMAQSKAPGNSSKTILNWPIAAFLILTPPAAIAGLIYLAMTGWWNLNTVIFTVIMIYATGMGITVGYHRHFSHRTFDAHPIVRALFLFFGGAAFQGSALDWALDHRRHHKFVDDNEKDPYSINKGFWFAHMKWLFYKTDDQLQFANEAPDLMNDPMVMFQDKYYRPLATVGSFLFPTLVAWTWGDPLGGFLVAGLFRVVFVHQGTFCINSVCHIFGKRTYSHSHSARDNWFTALFTFGEGYHNYHHEFASDYRNGIRFYDYDPSKWLIYGLSLIGLTSNLKRISKERILKRKIAIQEKELLEKLDNIAEEKGQSQVLDFSLKTINNAKDQMQTAYQKLVDLRSKHEGYRKDEFKGAARQTIKIELDGAMKEFNKTVSQWKLIVSDVNRLIKDDRELALAGSR